MADTSKVINTLKELVALGQGVAVAWGWIAAGGFATLLAFVLALPLWLMISAILLGVILVGLGAYRLRFISLEAAAIGAYEKLDGTLYGFAAERMHDERTPQATIEYMAQLLTLHMPLYGRKPPSRVRQLIPAIRVRRGRVERGAQILKSSDNREPDWTDLVVRRWDLWKGLRLMRANEDARKKAWGG